MKSISKISKDAMISADGEYRWWLSRVWNKGARVLVVIGLNPSEADGEKDDPTVRVLCGRAQRLDYSGIYLCNLFALRSTDPMGIKIHGDPVGYHNDLIIDMVTETFKDVLCVWGNDGSYLNRDQEVIELLTAKDKKRRGVKLYHLGLTKKGYPRHPLRLSYERPMVHWKDPISPQHI